eukprot:COSAG01_NODE_57258_length_313_cov_0.962617_1_plen_84_part_01
MQYAGINLKLWADREADDDGNQEQMARKRHMYAEAAQFCEVARISGRRIIAQRAGHTTWHDRFMYMHCCESYEPLGRLADKAAC